MINTILHGDALAVLKTLPSNYVQCCVTSPPYYGLRDYGIEGQIGLEDTPEEYIDKLVHAFREVKRVLKNDGTLWVNIGDSYAGNGKIDPYRTTSSGKIMPPQGRAPITEGLKPKDLIGIPWMLAFALRADGWYLRSEIIWHKPNCMPESVEDRPTKSHEQIFLLSKSERYYYNQDAIREPHTTESNIRDRGKERGWAQGALLTPIGEGLREWNHPLGRNKRSVWSVHTKPYSQAHFATFPTKLAESMILAGSRPDDIVLDPFSGAATTLMVASQFNRNWLGIELNAKYITLARKRIATLQSSLWVS